MTEFEQKLLEVLTDIKDSLIEIEKDLDILGWDAAGNEDQQSGLEILTDIRNNTSE